MGRPPPCPSCDGDGYEMIGAGSPDPRDYTGGQQQCRVCHGTGDDLAASVDPPGGRSGLRPAEPVDRGGCLLILAGALVLATTVAVVAMVGATLAGSERFVELAEDLAVRTDQPDGSVAAPLGPLLELIAGLNVWVDRPSGETVIPLGLAAATLVIAGMLTFVRRTWSRAWLRGDAGPDLRVRLMLCNLARAGVYVVGLGALVGATVVMNDTDPDVAVSTVVTGWVATLPRPWPWVVVAMIVVTWAGATTYAVAGKYRKLAAA